MKLKMIGILSMLFLSACQSTQGSYAGGSMAYNSAVTTLQSSGMQIVQQGNRVRIIIPSEDFFRPQTTHVVHSKEPALITLANFVAGYPNSPVQVIGYTDYIGTPAHQYYRSMNEAEVVAAFLWQGGVPLANTTIKAMGDKGTIACNATPQGRADNDRVEVLINYSR